MTDNTRRSFLRSLFGETLSVYGEFKGKPSYSFIELENTDDETFLQLVPVLKENITIRINDNCLYFRKNVEADYRRHGELGKYDDYLLERFDGNHSIKGLCLCLRDEYQLDQREALAEIRRLFFQLVNNGICLPA